MKSIFVVLASLVIAPCFAQRTVDVSSGNTRLNENVLTIVNGTPFVNVKFVRLVKGSPYFSDNWMPGYLVSVDDRNFKTDHMKLDLFDNEIHFQDAAGSEMIASAPMKEIVITYPSGENFKFVTAEQLPAANVKKGWYQWLYSGQASLYKYYDKMLSEVRPYNSATTEQTITTKERYFVTKDNKMVEIKKIKDFPSAFPDKKAELEEYLKSKDKKESSMDDRLGAMVEYYNRLIATPAK